MSNHNYSISLVSMLVPGELINDFIKKFNSEQPENKKITHPDELRDFFGDCDYFTIDDVETPDLHDLTGESTYVPDEYLLFYADKQPLLFERAYISKEEIIDEFKTKVGRYLPDDFNYENYIGHFSGVLWS